MFQQAANVSVGQETNNETYQLGESNCAVDSRCEMHSFTEGQWTETGDLLEYANLTALPVRTTKTKYHIFRTISRTFFSKFGWSCDL